MGRRTWKAGDAAARGLPPKALRRISLELNIASRSHLASTFGSLGASVGPRTGPSTRSHQEKEWWCLRRYILTMADADELEFPISVVKGERPDFHCTSGSRGLKKIICKFREA